MLEALLAAETTVVGDPIFDAILKAFGGIVAFAVLAVAIMRGWLVTGGEYQRVVEERNHEREERIKAQEALVERALPAVLDAQRILTRVADILDKRSR